MIISDDQPLVSVLVTCYNREAYIGETIESVLASLYTNFELIVVDDGSVDRTVAIARAYENKDSRVKVYVNERNLGDYHNRNKAAAYANGKYIKYLDSDDVIFPWGLLVMVDCMEKNPLAAIGFTSNVSLDIRYPVLLQPDNAYKMYYFRNLVLGIGPTGTIIRKDIFDSNNGFSGKQFVGDTELWLRITRQARSLWMPPGLFFWREHDTQQIVLEHRDMEVESVRHQINKYFLSSVECPLSEKDAKAALRNLTNIKCRSIVKEILKGRIVKGWRRKCKLGLNVPDFLNALFKNAIPDKMP
jgi:glycosyltransferase involved in cell wall biosynthesis